MSDKTHARFIETRPCVFCNKTSMVFMRHDEYERYKSDMLIQQALPDWSADKRELLVTGTHPECWAHMFSELDEDNDEYGTTDISGSTPVVDGGTV